MRFDDGGVDFGGRKSIVGRDAKRTVVVIDGSASFRNWPRSTKVSRILELR
jgi:hypothetical protein